VKSLLVRQPKAPEVPGSTEKQRRKEVKKGRRKEEKHELGIHR
jgi:hypothetical protein